MSDKQIQHGRGRPRTFDIEKACLIGERLFRENGYDRVGVAALTEAMGIKPPSFYAAFGSKAEFFERVLENYAATNLPVESILQEGRTPAEAVREVLLFAARQYTEAPQAPGCLAIETARSSLDPQASQCARQAINAKFDSMRAFIALTHPLKASAVTDFVEVSLLGLSACARDGWDTSRVVEAAQVAASAAASVLRYE
ncbi:transcriptional regulator, TetR family [Rhizobium sp. NFR07]|uniref:TetR/AcrR family transcriptional regulator n=1 Tax=Rhizobium sp. NFR07 TaxID=1566262 RepID=UPI0008F37BAF|nr:TetR/AcrR family transcriptional regulator [Rhizobium sp. NFR07]SFB55250.1 transcriptional regulator, TetR family [Rhizobium sp. NFR07]